MAGRWCWYPAENSDSTAALTWGFQASIRGAPRQTVVGHPGGDRAQGDRVSRGEQQCIDPHGPDLGRGAVGGVARGVGCEGGAMSSVAAFERAEGDCVLPIQFWKSTQD